MPTTITPIGMELNPTTAPIEEPTSQSEIKKFETIGKLFFGYKFYMNKENASKLWKIIQEAGDYLEGQLPNHLIIQKVEICTAICKTKI